MDQELSKSQRALKSNQWFKSYGHFTEGVDFAYWWSFSGGGSAINGATPSSFCMIKVSGHMLEVSGHTSETCTNLEIFKHTS